METCVLVPIPTVQCLPCCPKAYTDKVTHNHCLPISLWEESFHFKEDVLSFLHQFLHELSLSRMLFTVQRLTSARTGNECISRQLDKDYPIPVHCETGSWGSTAARLALSTEPSFLSPKITGSLLDHNLDWQWSASLNTALSMYVFLAKISRRLIAPEDVEDHRALWTTPISQLTQNLSTLFC